MKRELFLAACLFGLLAGCGQTPQSVTPIMANGSAGIDGAPTALVQTNGDSQTRGREQKGIVGKITAVDGEQFTLLLAQTPERSQEMKTPPDTGDTMPPDGEVPLSGGVPDKDSQREAPQTGKPAGMQDGKREMAFGEETKTVTIGEGTEIVSSNEGQSLTLDGLAEGDIVRVEIDENGADAIKIQLIKEKEA